MVMFGKSGCSLLQLQILHFKLRLSCKAEILQHIDWCVAKVCPTAIYGPVTFFKIYKINYNSSFKYYPNWRCHYLDTRYLVFQMLFRYIKQQICSDIQCLTVISGVCTTFFILPNFWLNFTKVFDNIPETCRMMCELFS